MIFTKTFGKNGIHPETYKNLTDHIPIESVDVPNIAYIPIQQHIGNAPKIIVNVGDIIEEGQLIAVGDGFISSNVHSSIPGKVIDIKDLYISNGKKSKSVVIELGGEFRKTGKKIQLNDYMSMSKEDILSKIKEYGIVGMGGATFPTHVKLTIPKEKKVKYFIINGAECEPYLSCDHRVMLEKTESILEGIYIVNKVLDAEKIIIGIETNKKDAIKRFKTLIHNRFSYKVVGLSEKYPQGDEKQLIKSLTDKIIPIGKLPIDIGAVVLNIQTIVAIKEALVNDKPLIERVVTVSGNGINHPKNLLVKIGTPIREIINQCGGLKNNNVKVVMGGPMMGFSQMNLDTPITKGTSGIICLTKSETSKFEINAVCINCGKCISSCAFGLLPTMINRYLQYKKYDKVKELNLMQCKECGACSWVCPSKIPLVQNFRYAKNIIKTLNI